MGGGLLCALVFAVLLGWRLGLIDPTPHRGESPPMALTGAPIDSERWMSIIQDGKPIGYTHLQLAPTENGFRLKEKVLMRLNTMGLVQDLDLYYDARLDDTMALGTFRFDMRSGRFTLAIEGRMEKGVLICRVESGGAANTTRLQFDAPPFLPAGILPAVAAAGLEPGRGYRFPIFDPATMGRGEVGVTVVGRRTVAVGKDHLEAYEVTLDYKGLRQQAWIDETGGILKEEGLLGLKQIRTTREGALQPLSASRDFTRLAAVTPDRPITRVEGLKRLKLRIAGIAPERLPASDLRQVRNGAVLTITRESLPEERTSLELAPDLKPFLAPAPMIQADAPRIRELAARLTADARTLRARIEAIMTWMDANIQKRPVLSLPDALNTLAQGMGDCNEHAVLLAALARAAGIPAQIEAGLVYQRGRFYYHAWNRVYLGGWVTVDALKGQMPADATHIRLARGNLPEQMEILPMIGKLTIQIIDAENDV
ncbi:MAG: transglutaminase family protein [Desulfobacterales bacterium]